jgi:hypothetical protein
MQKEHAEMVSKLESNPVKYRSKVEESERALVRTNHNSL